jgi:hypothetical protein
MTTQLNKLLTREGIYLIALLLPVLRIRDTVPFWVNSTIMLSVLGKKILYLFKNWIIYNFMIFVATNNGKAKLFSPSSFGATVGSGIRDG